MRSKKVQLAILDEIAGKSDGINPVKMDLSDKVTDSNFWYLKSKKYFAFADDSEAQEIAVSFGGDPVFPLDLSDEGHEYHATLTDWWEKLELRRQVLKSADEANNIARTALAESKKANDRFLWSLLVAGVSALSAAGALIVSCFCR